MTIHDKGRYEFEFSFDERQDLLQAAEVLRSLATKMRSGQYELLVVGYPDNPDSLTVEEIENCASLICHIKTAWAVE